ncbi:hypothetical protein WMF38_57745 [Sorangium sp. So ce118]
MLLGWMKAATRQVVGRWVEVEHRPGKRTSLGHGGWSERASITRWFVARRERASAFAFLDGRREYRVSLPSGYLYLDNWGDHAFLGHSDGSVYGKTYIMVAPSVSPSVRWNCSRSVVDRAIGPVRVVVVLASDVKKSIRAKFGDKKTPWEELHDIVSSKSAN